MKARGNRANGQISRGRGSADDTRRLAKIKEAIRAGRYETPEKLDAALKNLLADLRKLRPTMGITRADETGGERP